jgi:hypothetical protein
MKNTLITLLVIIIIGFGGYFFIKNMSGGDENGNVSKETNSTTTGSNENKDDLSVVVENKTETIIGKSVEGRNIVAYHYGTGDTELLLIGGVHGGYSWNTSLVAYETMDYLQANLTSIPANVRVTVMPVSNPDGLYKVTGKEGRFTASDVSPSQSVQVSGRFNANNVDLSRNFDCEWQANAKWQNKTVSGGSVVFSEPESLAIKNYIETQKPKGVVVWYSAAGGVYASKCGNTGILPETSAITNLYAKASGYPAFQSYDFYATTGDLVNWLAKNGVPAISVLLTNHTDTEWTKNQKGIESLLLYYKK